MSEKRDSSDLVKWFSELSNKDVPIAGGKGASLAEMYNAKIPVPPGFVVTAEAYRYFVQKTGLDKKVKSILDDVDVDNTEELTNASKEIRAVVEGQNLPKDMQDAILEAYEILDARKPDGNTKEDALAILRNSHEEPFVAVRSSATTEDLADASFAGQQDTFLNVKGKHQLIEKVKKCISSLFTARAIYYREKKGFDHTKAYLAVVVQKMVDSDKSGVMFSQNPVSDDKSIVIEAVFGLGEGIVSGQIKPDHHAVSADLDNFEVLETKISNKKLAITRNASGENKTVKLTEQKANQPVLTAYEIKRLAQYARQLEEHYEKPQDIEFAIEQGEIYIVQSRPITTAFKKSEDGSVSGKELMSGLAASPGVASGKVKIVKTMADLPKVKKGDVLVTEMTNPDMVVTMQRAAAIVTDEGGITSHAAIVSREMGIPAVVGTGDATKRLQDESVITVDGNVGKVYEGKGETKLAEVLPVVQTKTKIKVIVDIPDFADRAALSKVDAVGLTRLEGIIAAGGKHPIKFLQDDKIEDYVTLLVDGLKRIIKPFNEIWIRTSDIRSDEYRNLEGAPKEVEGNPMLGDHGIRFSLKNVDIMRAELMAAKEVADDFPGKVVGLMTPQIISVDELKKTKALAKEVGMPKNTKIGIMVETPAAVQIINDLLEEGVDFISFGTNDLTQYTLAIDRNNPGVQDLFDETNPAVVNSIRYVIRRCKKYGVETSICGQAGSREDMVKILVAEGISSISVNADAAQKISKLVARVENSGSSGDSNTEEVASGNFSESAGGGAGGSVSEQDGKKVEVVPMVAGSNGNGEDIEQTVLKALGPDDSGDEEYQPGESNGARGKGDVPSLNESVPIDSEMFLTDPDEAEKEQEIELAEEWVGEVEKEKKKAGQSDGQPGNIVTT